MTPRDEIEARIRAWRRHREQLEQRPVAMSADELRELRAAAGMTQAELARRLRVSLRQYKRYEQSGIPIAARLRADAARRVRRRA